MDSELQKRLDDQDKKLDAIFRSAEKTRKAFKWTLIITVVTIILPLLGLLFVIPTFLKYYSSLSKLGGLGF